MWSALLFLLCRCAQFIHIFVLGYEKDLEIARYVTNTYHNFQTLLKKKKVKSYLYNVDENDSLFLLTLKRHFEEILVKTFIFSPSNPMHKHTYFSLVFFVPHYYCIRSSSIKSFSVLFYSRF